MGGANAGRIENGGIKVEQFHDAGTDSSALKSAGDAGDKGHMEEAIVGAVVPFFHEAVIAGEIPMVGKDEEGGLIPETAHLKLFDDSAEQVVGPGDHAPVNGADFAPVGFGQFRKTGALVIEGVIRVFAFEMRGDGRGDGGSVVEGEPGLFDRVGGMGEMEGEENAERLFRGMGDEVQGGVHEGGIAVMAWGRLPFSLVESGLPFGFGRGEETGFIAGRDSGFPFVEGEGDCVGGQGVVLAEAGGVIAGFLQVAEEVVFVGVQQVEEGAVAMGMGVESGEEGATGGGAKRVLGEAAGEGDACLGEGVHVRRLGAAGGGAEHGVCTDGFWCEQDEVGSVRAHAGWGRISLRREVFRRWSSWA